MTRDNPTFSLADAPWIPALTTAGQARTISGRDALEYPGRYRAVGGRTWLGTAAILQFLLAARSAARGKPGQWLDEHADDLDLFNPTKPFLQNGSASTLSPPERYRIAPSALDPFAGGNGPLLTDHRWGEPNEVMSAADAAQNLLVHQMFTVGGMTAFPSTPGWSHSTHAALHNARAFSWIDADTLEGILERNALPTEGGDVFRFTWPHLAPVGVKVAVTGPLTVATWMTHSVWLHPCDNGAGVDGVIICKGFAPAPPEAVTPTVMPNSLWMHDTKKGVPAKAVHISADTPSWRAPLTALAETPRLGIADRLRPHDIMHTVGFCSFQSRIDGIVHMSTPVGDLDPTRFAAALDGARRIPAGITRIVAGQGVDPDSGSQASRDSTPLGRAIAALSPGLTAAYAAHATDIPAPDPQAPDNTPTPAEMCANSLVSASHRSIVGLRHGMVFSSDTGHAVHDIPEVAARTVTDIPGWFPGLLSGVAAARHAHTTVYSDLRSWKPGVMTSALAALLSGVPASDVDAACTAAVCALYGGNGSETKNGIDIPPDGRWLPAILSAARNRTPMSPWRAYVLVTEQHSPTNLYGRETVPTRTIHH